MMADLTALSVSPSLLTPPSAATSAAELAKRGQIKDTARKFESSFLSVMLGQMFEGTDTPAPFGGGPGEAMAKKMTEAGGIGVSAALQREMLKMQGLS
jgi:flagellar protein FlgJ